MISIVICNWVLLKKIYDHYAFYNIWLFMIKVKVRWLAVLEDKILLCKLKEYWFFCLPWWTMDWWEDRVTTLRREFIEELNVEPEIGELLYVHEFINWKKTTLDFRYDIKNPKSFTDVDLSTATHWYELSEVGFYSLDWFDWDLRPTFLWKLAHDLKKDCLNFNKKYE